MVARACGLSYLGAWGGRIAWAQEFKVTVSYDHATALQPGQQSKIISLKKRGRKGREGEAREVALKDKKIKDFGLLGESHL